MTQPPRTRTIPGRAILAEVRNTYRDAYASTLQERGTRITVVRFAPTAADPRWHARMEASRISAEQKVRTFAELGATPDHIIVPDTIGIGDLARIIHRANVDPRTAGIIVQAPPPQAVLGLLNEIDPAKDLDSLGVFATRAACATADGVVRIAEPYLPNAQVAVVGSNGFVGSGVVALLHQRGITPMRLDLGDDLRRLREADVVLSTTGSPWLLTPEHIHTGHRLVVDSGFSPHPAGPRGDLHPAAAGLPGTVTPVPGGIGPVEMAVLAERVVQREAAPDLEPWRFLGLDSGLSGLTTAQTATSPAEQLQQDREYDLGHDWDDGAGLDLD